MKTTLKTMMKTGFKFYTAQNARLAAILVTCAALMGTGFAFTPAIPVHSTADLMKQFEALDYKLELVKADRALPDLEVAGLPKDFKASKYDPYRKQMFVKILLPLITKANGDIADQRTRLEALDLADLSYSDRTFLGELRQQYNIPEDADNQEAHRQLMIKVDIIPPSLALSQAIVESGWGTSRFAQEGNALFGMQIRSTDDADGLKPSATSTRRIIPYKTLYDSVASYMSNLNSHWAYKDFRKLRVDLRDQGTVTGTALAAGLIRYSEKREVYINLLRRIIATNDLNWFDRVEFAQL